MFKGESGGAAERYIDALKDAMTANGCETLELILLTHHHHDHIGGLTAVLLEYPGTPVAMYEYDSGWLAREVTARTAGKFGGRFVAELNW